MACGKELDLINPNTQVGTGPILALQASISVFNSDVGSYRKLLLWENSSEVIGERLGSLAGAFWISQLWRDGMDGQS